jgi:integrase
MSVSPSLDSLGRRRSPAAVPGHLAGRRPGSKSRHYPADPPRVEEIVAVMRCCGDGAHGDRARGLIVVLWRAGLRIQEALDLTELDLDPRRGSVLVRRGKGGHRREVGMDDWGFEQLEPWLEARRSMPVGPRQLGHRNLGVTSIYLQGIDPDEIIQGARTTRAAPNRPQTGHIGRRHRGRP